MAKEENKNTKPGFGQRFVDFFKGIGRSFKNMFHEMKKVSWPTPKQVLKNTVIVIGCVLVVGVFIWMFDLIAGVGINGLIDAFNH